LQNLFCNLAGERYLALRRVCLKIILLASTLLGTFAVRAEGFIPESDTLNHNTLLIYAPHIFNPKYFGFEFGYVTKKSINSIQYPFNAFAKACLLEEYYTTNSELRAGGLGAKAGLFLPTQPWIPLYLEVAGGFPKPALHKDPWFGKNEQSVSNQTMFLAEGGIAIRYGDKVLLRGIYQVNNVKYFKKKFLFSVGVNY